MVLSRFSTAFSSAAPSTSPPISNRDSYSSVFLQTLLFLFNKGSAEITCQITYVDYPSGRFHLPETSIAFCI